MRLARLFLSGLLWAGLLIFSCAYAETAVTTIVVPVANSQPIIGGPLDETWSKADSITLAEDFTYRRPPGEKTEVKVLQDGSALDVAFEVTQQAALTQTQRTNGSGVLNDDYVGVYLWPQGTQGFSYGFFANPRGTRYQTSSENSAYTPQWSAYGQATSRGYMVSMRIPYAIIRSGGSHRWRAQFVRFSVETNALDVWSYSPSQVAPNDPAFAGSLDDMAAKLVAHRTPARAQIYGLGEATTTSNGGSTSRVGVDLGLPVTATSSFLASIHPDYSNVELDQQTISPTAFPRSYAEVRPFFTQGSSSFNYDFSCINCASFLYTPSIPTFRDGYAYEGTQGPLIFGAFDAIGYGRDDQAEALTWSASTTGYSAGVGFQRVAASLSDGVRDNVTSISGGYGFTPLHLLVWANLATDRGSSVTNPGLANFVDAGVGYATPMSYAFIAYDESGAQFEPVDGFVSQSDINGYQGSANRTFTFSARSPLHDIATYLSYVEYHNQFGQVDQSTLMGNLNFDFRNLVTLRFSGGSEQVRAADDQLLPFDANTIELGYRIATATPAYVQYGTGAYYHGRLNILTAATTRTILPRVNLSLQLQKDDYLDEPAFEPRAEQWLDRATIDWQISKDAELDAGVRKIVGIDTPNSYEVPNFSFATETNVSVAFHFLRKKDEFYVIYGDPNSLSTTPALFVKWIRYIGADKGT